MQNSKLRKMILAAVFGAVAFVLMFFSFSVPIISPFAEFDAAPLPEIIGGFILGPLGTLAIVVVKLLLKLLMEGSSTLLTGELSNFILSLAYALPAVLYYRRHRTKKGAIIGLAIGTVIEVIMGVLTNLYLIFPLYINLYDMSWDAIVSMCSAVNPWIRDVPTMMAFSVVPFNILSRGIVSVITVLVYKKISVPLKKMIQDDKKSEKKQEKELAK
ncbi:MAG: ECF transporter S component [Ruminococcaceae bacterium]|nr:ECF transporter S component [Oscillospiraceae bacterium]